MMSALIVSVPTAILLWVMTYTDSSFFVAFWAVVYTLVSWDMFYFSWRRE